MKAPLELVHLMPGLLVTLLLTELDTLGGWTMDRLAGDSVSGMEMVPPPL